MRRRYIRWRLLRLRLRIKRNDVKTKIRNALSCGWKLMATGVFVVLLAKYEFKGNPTLWRKLFLNCSLIAVQRRICNDEKLTVFFC